MRGKPPQGFYQKKTRARIVLSGFALFIIAVGLVTVLALHNSKKQNDVALVYITNKGFEPGTIVVHQGTKVVWTNNDQTLHQVASNPFPKDNGLPALKSEILNNAQTYQFTADKVGSFNYHDDLKPTINGTIVVEKK